MKLIKDFDNFFLPVNDLEQAKKFYHDQLGFELKFDFSDKGMIAFKVGAQEPAIILKKDEELKPAIWFEVDDVFKVYEELKQKGIQFLTEPFEIHTGFSVEFLDPFGNKFGLTDYSKWVDQSHLS